MVITESDSRSLLRILHVDDEPLELQLRQLQTFNKYPHICVEQATSVSAAFKVLREQHIDVIVSDYQMPGKNGLEFLKDLSDDKILHQIPFVFLTGQGDEELASSALEAGAAGYYPKESDIAFNERFVRHLEMVVASRNNEIAFKSFFESAPFGVAENRLIIDENGVPADYRIITVNQAYYDHTGIPFDVEGMLGSEAYDHSPAPYLDEFAEVALHKRDVLSFEEYYPELDRVFSTIIQSSKLNHFTSIFRDVTDRARAVDHSQILSTLLDKRDVITGYCTSHGQIIFLNRAGLSFVGRKDCEDLVMQEFQPQDQQDWVENSLLTPFRKASILDGSDSIYTASGTLIDSEGKLYVGEYEAFEIASNFPQSDTRVFGFIVRDLKPIAAGC